MPVSRPLAKVPGSLPRRRPPRNTVPEAIIRPESALRPGPPDGAPRAGGARGRGAARREEGNKKGEKRMVRRDRDGSRGSLHPHAALAATLAILLIATAPPHRAGAQEARPAAPQPTSVWLYSLYKTITYETAANLADVPLYYTVLAGAQAGTALFSTVNVLT